MGVRFHCNKIQQRQTVTVYLLTYVCQSFHIVFIFKTHKSRAQIGRYYYYYYLKFSGGEIEFHRLAEGHVTKNSDQHKPSPCPLFYRLRAGQGLTSSLPPGASPSTHPRRNLGRKLNSPSLELM